MSHRTQCPRCAGSVRDFPVRWALACLGLALLGGGWLRAAGEAPLATSASPGLLREARQVLDLSPAQLKQNHPVQLQLVATHVDVGYGLVFGHDKTAGLYLSCFGKALDFKPGSLLEVKGTARQGLFAPFLDVQDLRVLGEQALPPARLVTIGQILSGSLDSQWVEVIGLIHSERLSRGRLQLEMMSGLNRLRIGVVNSTNYEQLKLTDSLARLRGVVASEVDSNRRVTGFKLLVNDLSDITITEAAPDVAALPPRLAKDLMSHEVRRVSLHRVRGQGIVTLHVPGKVLFMQDPTGGVRVETSFADKLEPGDRVDVLGFLSLQLDSVCLEDATVRKLEKSDLPLPISVAVEQAFSGAHDNTLVELEANLIHQLYSESNVITLVLASGARTLTASTQPNAAALPRLEIGSRLRLTGVCQRQPLTARTSPTVHLWLRSPTDVRLLSLPPSKSTARFLFTGCALVVSVLLAAQFIIHRRRTEKILQQQNALQMQIRQNEEQLRRSLQERERIGQDLHDDIIQSIYAVGLGLEDARRRFQKAPEVVEPRLSAAISSLNDIIRNVRSFIGGMESKVLNGRELKTALKSLALTTGESQAQFAIEVDTAAANLLTSNEATQLLHIAKEAMSNSLRHAQATRVTVTLQPAGQGVRLEILDDGVGFDATCADQRGQGLRNMKARAASLGGRLEIISAPGQGGRIVVVIPKQTTDEHN